MKKTAAAITAGVLAISLAGCASTPTSFDDPTAAADAFVAAVMDEDSTALCGMIHNGGSDDGELIEKGSDEWDRCITHFDTALPAAGLDAARDAGALKFEQVEVEDGATYESFMRGDSDNPDHPVFDVIGQVSVTLVEGAWHPMTAF